ncbi:hypothetical protein M422DRAFT_49836 [Sphaerobolus stellatus SS14]|uniref:Uncharacterized protein n=1 Tax=Sphaerobolus stellatus (strain SS14) TaxID=990650 RepID=A0A0C9VM49_SPHS4|nr:hypothetical protein M422DRAFT_49836 [Sphaerobolus stellatus SS14]
MHMDLERVSHARNLEVLDYTDGVQDFLERGRALLLGYRRNYLDGDLPAFRTVSFPSVKTFYFSGDNTETYYHILNTFDMPAVINLGLKAPYVDDTAIRHEFMCPLTPSDAFHWISKQHTSNLQILFLGHFWMGGGDQSHLKEAIHLRKIVLFRCWLQPDFFSKLKLYNIPALERIVTYSCKLSFDDLKAYIEESSGNVTITIRFANVPTKAQFAENIRLATLSATYPNLIVEYSHLVNSRVTTWMICD